MTFIFQPWDDLANNAVLHPLSIEEPPCKHCKYWSPRAITDAKGVYSGVQLCMVEDMNHDFSCFESKESE